MNAKKISAIVYLRYILLAVRLCLCVFFLALTLFAQNTQTSKNKADQNLKSSARVNPSTLAMEFSLPLGNYPGRGGNSTPIVFSYSSKVWNMQKFKTRFELVDIPPTQNYHHIAYTSTEVAAIFAEKTAAGWTSDLKPFKIVGVPEIYDESGGIFQPVNASGNNRVVPGCYYDTIGMRLSNICPSGMEYAWHETCYDANSQITVDRDIIYCVEFGGGGGGGGGGVGGNPTGGTTQLTPNMVYRFRIEMPDGSTKEFRKDDRIRDCTADPSSCDGGLDGTYLSVDSSGMRFEHDEQQPDDSTKDVLYLPDGSKYIFPVVIPTPTYGKLIDKNGNYSLYDPINKVWTDTVGREFADPLDTPEVHGSTPGTYPVTLKGISNADLTYPIEWTTLDNTFDNPRTQLKYLGPDACDQLQANPVYGDSLFENQETTPLDDQIINQIRYISQTRVCANGWGIPPNYALFNPLVMASISLPDGSKYEFKYNEYGEITKIIYPTGGYERFEYGYVPPMGMTALEVYTQGNRGVLKRYVSVDGSTESQVWTYGMFYEQGAAYGLRTIAPDGSKTERILHTSISSGFGYEDPRDGMAKEERTYDSNGVLRSRSLNDWIVLGPQGQSAYGAATRDPRLSRTVSILFDPNSTSALATMSEMEYDESGSIDPTYFPHLNVKRKKGYHYAVVNKADVAIEQLSWATIVGWFTGKLASVSETDYSYDPDYRARGIIGLATESRMLNPTNVNDVLSKGQTVYDESGYALINEGSITGWSDPGSTLRANPTTIKQWVKETDTWLSGHAQYDNFGNLRKAWDASGDSTKYVETVYEHTTAHPYFFAYPVKVISPAPDANNTYGTNQTSTAETTYDFTTGLPLSVKDDFGQVTTTDYDSISRPTRVNPVVVNGIATGPVSETIYAQPDSGGHFDLNDWNVKVRKQIDANNWNEVKTYIDGLGRTKKSVSSDSQGDVTVQTDYDLIGRPYLVSNPYRAGDTVYWTRTRFDELGRGVESYAPAVWSYASASLPNSNLVSLGTTSFGISDATNYVGTVVTTKDASGRRGRSITNALGHLLRVDEPTAMGGSTADADLGSIASPAQPTSYTYDLYGNMVKVEQGGSSGQKRYFKYDSLGRLIRVNQPEQEINPNIWMHDPYNSTSQWTAAFTYDNLGNVVTATDAKNTVIANTYDRANRVIFRGYYNETPSGLTPNVSFFYDGRGLASTQSPNYAKGKLTKISNGISETRYKLFDNFGRLKEMEQRTPFTDMETTATTTPKVSKYTYNLSGALLEEEYPSGRKINNEYETDGDLKRVYGKANSIAPEHTYINSFSYTAAGGVSQMRLGNGRWETAHFNNRLQITQLGLGTSATDTSLWKTDYQYGELNNDGSVNVNKDTGNIAKLTLTIPGTSFTQFYKYDPLYRLTEAMEVTGTSTTTNWTQNFGYDVYGNRTSFSQNIGGVTNNTTPVVSSSTNRFTSTSFTYDKNGNIIADVDPATSQARTFVFNGDNKQTDVKDANGNPVGKYYYDGEGKRVKKVTNSETTIFVYSAGKLIEEYSTQISSNPTIAYTTPDHLGSPRVITDQYGMVKSRRDFMPFGENIFTGVGGRTGDTGQKYASTQDDVRQKFTGYQKDSETSLDFAEARMYENRFGRFTAIDPLLASGKSANPQSFNRYIYVGNSPLFHVDPTGLIWGKADDGRVRWFKKKLGEGFSEFHPENWQYVGVNGRITQLDPNSSKFWERDVKLVPGTETEAIHTFAISGEQSATETRNGILKGVGNFFINTWNGATQPFGQAGGLFGVPNPFAITVFTASTWKEAMYINAAEIGTEIGTFFAAAPFAASKTLPVVPKEFTVPIPKPASFPKPVPVNGNSLSSMRPTWGYKLFRQGEETFLKNGITSQPKAEARYTQAFMSDKYMIKEIFPNRSAARTWEIMENTVSPGPLNIRR